ncbi:MAG TPA: hypothetical protein VHE81_22875 [Lacipirellulaceae bacterium]|nr:hypothetical protein [Lacipirellulaceae bacterium]
MLTKTNGAVRLAARHGVGRRFGLGDRLIGFAELGTLPGSGAGTSLGGEAGTSRGSGVGTSVGIGRTGRDDGSSNGSPDGKPGTSARKCRSPDQSVECDIKS